MASGAQGLLPSKHDFFSVVKTEENFPQSFSTALQIIFAEQMDLAFVSSLFFFNFFF